ncbi:MAG TPA: response regulator transcription factor [Beijerinckiaceae bacterium]|nr:response regulator transcription factor [Beijerinckiaceae bacterium]
MVRLPVPLLDDAPHVLVVDDDSRIRSLLSKFLKSNGYRVTTAGNAAEAREHLNGLAFDLLVLDVMMPGESGFDLARAIRKTSSVPILMLTALTDLDDRLKGLELGADDYLGKPFDPRELLLRVNSILRRVAAVPPAAAPVGPEMVRFGPFQFHLGRGELKHGEDTVRLTNRERDILRQFAQALGSTVARELLADPDSGANERTIDVQINRLRRKIEPDAANPTYLQTVRGVGYRLVVDP